MRLYSLDGATAVVHPDHGEFTANDDGAFDFPDVLAAHLHRQPSWEDDAERQARLDAEDDARRKDPATLLAAVEALAQKVAEPARKTATRKPRGS